jgi:parallel beta-helix repeat protein
MKRKCLAIGIILLFVGTTIIPAIAQNTEESQTSRGNTIYVDDDNVEGPWDGTQEHPYRYIKDGVNTANDNDTVFVFNGLYHEGNIYIGKSITIIGEDRDNTIIDGGGSYLGFELNKDSIKISGFTIQNYSNWLDTRWGIHVQTDHNIISGNRIQKCNIGIGLVYCNYNIIQGNIIEDNSGYGIDSFGSLVNTIIGNHIVNNGNGVLFYNPNNWGGNFLSIFFGPRGNFSKNNIFSNSHDNIRFENTVEFRLKNNYWGLPLPIKVIQGKLIKDSIAPGCATTYIIKKVDWHPALKPYDIPGMT